MRIKLFLIALFIAAGQQSFAGEDSSELESKDLEKKFQKIKTDALEFSPGGGYAPFQGPERIICPLKERHQHLIIGGSGQSLQGYRIGVGNETHYTVNIMSSEDPDYLANMNGDLSMLPDNRFETIIAANIPIVCFEWNFFLNALRLLKPGGYLIGSTFQSFCSYWDESVKRDVPHNIEGFTSLLSSIGFRLANEQLNIFKGSLMMISFLLTKILLKIRYLIFFKKSVD
jgi:hypothetical protein